MYVKGVAEASEIAFGVSIQRAPGDVWHIGHAIVAMLKDYLNTGHFGRDTEEFASECSVVFAGNIECDRTAQQVAVRCRNLFDPLPEVMGRDCAFLDRIHGFLPGWTAPQISESRLARGVGFMADYLSEIMHQMRSRNYSPILLDHDPA